MSTLLITLNLLLHTSANLAAMLSTPTALRELFRIGVDKAVHTRSGSKVELVDGKVGHSMICKNSFFLSS